VKLFYPYLTTIHVQILEKKKKKKKNLTTVVMTHESWPTPAAGKPHSVLVKNRLENLKVNFKKP
jgi:hypothetical protein